MGQTNATVTNGVPVVGPHNSCTNMNYHTHYSNVVMNTLLVYRMH